MKHKINSIKTLIQRAYCLSSNYQKISTEINYTWRIFFTNNRFPLKLFETIVGSYLNRIKITNHNNAYNYCSQGWILCFPPVFRTHIPWDGKIFPESPNPKLPRNFFLISKTVCLLSCVPILFMNFNVNLAKIRILEAKQSRQRWESASTLAFHPGLTDMLPLHLTLPLDNIARIKITPLNIATFQ